MKNWNRSCALSMAVVAAGLLSSSCHAQTVDLSTPAAKQFFLRDGDRPIVFLGDSITEQRMYTTLIESYVLSRFPTWNVTFRNIGWSGDATPMWLRKGYEVGMPRDVLPLKPAAILVDYGMNDARSGDEGYSRYVEYSMRIAQDLKKAGARVALITPSPEEKYEDGEPGGSAYNHMLAKYSNGLKEVAAKENVLFVDQYTPFINVIEQGRAAGVLAKSEAGPRLIPDAVHPNWAGHLVMAASILKGLGAPSLVSSVAVDAKAKTATAQNAAVKVLSNPNSEYKGAIAFTRLDSALPWPISPEAGLALNIPGFSPLSDLSRYELKATNLEAKRYEVSVDGQSVGKFSREELATGINLSNSAGPISQQGQQLFERVVAKNNLFFTRWREVQLYQPPAWFKVKDADVYRKAELERLDAQIATAEKEINALRKPVVHTWTLNPETPAAPSGLKISTAQNRVQLSWNDDAADESGFTVERSTDGENYQKVATLKPDVVSYVDADATPGQPLYYRVRSFGEFGPSVGSTVGSNQWKGTGLTATYFSGTNFETQKVARLDNSIDFNWDKVAPAEGMTRENFSVRWTGFIQPRYSETYTFGALSDDGVRLTIDGRPLVNDWVGRAPTESKATIALQAGKKYPITVEYFQGTYGAEMHLFWQSRSQAREIVPVSQLYPANK